MGSKIDLTNLKFGKLTVIRESGRKNEEILWECICECGKVKVISGHSLRRGDTQSCGCSRKGLGTTHGLTATPIYNVWVNMRKRCYSPYSTEFELYGGRGIEVCDRWKDSFENFYEDMKDGYSEGLSIDRIDVNGNYSMENCRWASRITQQNNTRRNKWFVVNGKAETLSNLCRTYSKNYSTVQKRLRLGWNIERALLT